MRWCATVIGAALLAGAAPSQGAEGYITGVLSETLDLYREDGTGPIHNVKAGQVTGPIMITGTEGDDWLEIAVEGAYYLVKRKDVLVSKPNTPGGTPFSPAGTPGIGLGLHGN